MNIEIDFDIQKDLEEMCRIFFEENPKFTIGAKHTAFHQFCALQHKLIQPKPRNVLFAKNFKIPSKYSKEVKTLVSKIIDGENINGYLSKGSFNLSTLDGMLDDFGIYHFHLGSTYKGEFIERTKEVAFAFINKESVFFIEILPHGNSNDVDKLLWFRSRYIKIIHKEQPALINNFKVNGIPAIEIEDADRKILRNKNVNSIIQINENTSYLSPGSGFVGSGLSAKAILLANSINNQINLHAIDIKNYLLKNITSDTDASFLLKLTNFEGSQQRLNTEFKLININLNEATHKVIYRFKKENEMSLTVAPL